MLQMVAVASTSVVGAFAVVFWQGLPMPHRDRIQQSVHNAGRAVEDRILQAWDERSAKMKADAQRQQQEMQKRLMERAEDAAREAAREALLDAADEVGAGSGGSRTNLRQEP